MTTFTKTTVKLFIDGAIVEVNGYEFEYAFAKKQTRPMHVCKYKDSWQVIEPSTGLYISKGNTRKGVIDVVNMDNIKEQFAKTIKTAKFGEYIRQFEEACGYDAVKPARKPKAQAKKPAARRQPCKKQTPKATKPPKTTTFDSANVTLEAVEKWCKEHDLEAKQVHKGSTDNIWIVGESRDFKDELVELGFRWGKSKKFGKGWYRRPSK